MEAPQFNEVKNLLESFTRFTRIIVKDKSHEIVGRPWTAEEQFYAFLREDCLECLLENRYGVL
jgi:hypothetical protein